MNARLLVFASHNQHKTGEIRSMLGPGIVLRDLTDIGHAEEIPEPHDTLEENALAKARFIAATCNADCFADDTGLEVAALGGLPGVLSARYAGPAKDPDANTGKLLQELSGAQDRSARFRTIIALVTGGQEYLFEGTVKGKITHSPRGMHGFGYDPVFVPDGYTRTFAELPAKEKNRISHRKEAIARLAAFLETRLRTP